MANELDILRKLSQGASDQQLRSQLQTALQNLKQEANNAQLAAEQSTAANSQPQQAKKITAQNIAHVTRGIIDFIKLGANAEQVNLLSSVANGLGRVKGDSLMDHRVVASAINTLSKVVSNHPVISAQAKQVFAAQDQISMSKMYRSVSDLLVQQPWAKEIVQKAVGEEMVNGAKKEETKNTNTETNTTSTSTSASPGMGMRAGG